MTLDTLLCSQPMALLDRARAEYEDRPTLHLTPSQMQRLLGATPPATASVLERLVADRFLRKTSDGYFVRVGAIHVSPRPRGRIAGHWWWLRVRRLRRGL